MPTSHFYQISTIVEVMFRLQPKSVLDVGVGFGKYGILAREYLESGDGYKPFQERKIKIDGIEGFKEYIQEGQRFFYDNIHIGNAINVLSDLGNYDLILLIDVLEHFTREDGLALLEQCYKKGKHVLISTPLDIGVQGVVYGNAYEQHKYQWKRSDLKKFEPVTFIRDYESLLCLVGPEAKRIVREMMWRHFKLGVKSFFPFVFRVYMWVRHGRR